MGKNKKVNKQKVYPGKSKSKNVKVKLKQDRKVKKRHTWKSVREKRQQVGLGEGHHEEQVEDEAVTVAARPHQTKKKISTKPKSEQTSLRSRMLQRLSVARFRTLNESMDSSPKSSSLSDSSTFKAYHAGLQAASSTWKTNPLDNIVSWIKSTQGSSKIVADFGCGDASLSTRIPNETHSFDLHALNPSVVACDMRNVPLEDGSVDVVVFCLSLMGSEVGDFIREAWRVLKLNGMMKVAEVRGRIENVGKFLKQVEGIGFKRVGSVEELDGGVFAICGFRKVMSRRNGGDGKVELKSVVYKKR